MTTDDASKSDLVFTGERFVPGEGGSRIAYEHFHRYFFAQRLARGKVVLDLGCGEGYGSSLLAEVAESVIGMDLSQETVGHARLYYPRANLNFVVADCRKTGLPAQQFDLVVCFEMIEHISEHEQLLAEVCRVLKPDGIFVVSSPDKESYSDESGSENPYHVKELYIREFQAMLSRGFPHVTMFAQSLCFGSILWNGGSPEKRKTLDAELIEVKPNAENNTLLTQGVEGRTKYAVAICSRAELEPRITTLAISCLNDRSETIVRDLERQNRELLNMIDNLHGHLRNVGNLLIDKDNRIAQRDLAIQEKENHIKVLHQVIEGKDNIISDKDHAIQARDQAIQAKDQEITGRDHAVLARDARIAGLEQGMQVLREFEIKVKGSVMWTAYRVFLRPLRLLFKRGGPS